MQIHVNSLDVWYICLQANPWLLFTSQGLMKLAGRPVAAFDPDGLIFAAGINSESVKLYDLRWRSERENDPVAIVIIWQVLWQGALFFL